MEPCSFEGEGCLAVGTERAVQEWPKAKTVLDLTSSAMVDATDTVVIRKDIAVI